MNSLEITAFAGDWRRESCSGNVQTNKHDQFQVVARDRTGSLGAVDGFLWREQFRQEQSAADAAVAEANERVKRP